MPMVRVPSMLLDGTMFIGGRIETNVAHVASANEQKRSAHIPATPPTWSRTLSTMRAGWDSNFLGCWTVDAGTSRSTSTEIRSKANVELAFGLGVLWVGTAVCVGVGSGVGARVYLASH